jgi:hypothetical protein
MKVQGDGGSSVSRWLPFCCSFRSFRESSVLVGGIFSIMGSLSFRQSLCCSYYRRLFKTCVSRYVVSLSFASQLVCMSCVHAGCCALRTLLTRFAWVAGNWRADCGLHHPCLRIHPCGVHFWRVRCEYNVRLRFSLMKFEILVCSGGF